MDNNKTAILIMDMQMAILSRLPDNGKNVIAKVGAAVETARKNGILPVFVRLGFQNGMPEISPKNKLFYGLKSMTDEQLQAFMEIHPGTGFTKQDILVNKKRVSAFSGNDLEMILQSAGIAHLVLCGIATSGIVLSTLCSAFDKDYQITILSDACEDTHTETHIHLIEEIFPKYATVTTVENWG